PRRQPDRSGVPGRVEARAGRSRAVAEVGRARPEVDACRGRLVGVEAALAPGSPSPRPDRRHLRVLCDLACGERLPLDGLEPRRAVETFAAALAALGLEAEHDAELRPRNPERGEVVDRPPERLPEHAGADDRTGLPDR